MTTKEFWKIYISKDGIVKYFDDIFDFFSKDLPTEFVDKYDVGEVILEVSGHNQTAKNFDKVLKFIELLQEKHPALYKEYFQYFDDFLIDYYSFHNNRAEVEKSFSNFLENPLQGYDELLSVLKKLLFYQYYELVDKTVLNSYDSAKNSDELIPGAEYDLAILKYYINLEYFYTISTDKTPDKKEFEKSMLPFDFKFKGNTLDLILKGIINPDVDSETIKDKFIKNRHEYMLTLQSQFLVHMNRKKFGFVLSGRLWDKMLEFWEDEVTENKKKQKQIPDDYFKVNIESYEKYLSSLSGDFLTDNRSEMIAVLWASVYIYDFLLSIGLINQATYDSFQLTSKILKGKVIANFTSELWNSNFVHYWEKPHSVSDTEFNEESKIFKKSLNIKSQDFKKTRNVIKEELENIGELSESIIQGAEVDNNEPKNVFEKFIQNPQPELFDDSQQNFVPVRMEPKIGRNDPCPCGSGKKYKKCCGK
jgi:hypothetical protein